MLAALFTLFTPCSTVQAYLTDSHDARTVPLGDLELELQPVGYYWDPLSDYDDSVYITPSLSLYAGLSDWLDVILRARGYSSSEGYRVEDLSAHFRVMLRRGGYGDADDTGDTRPNLALQIGAHFPSYNGRSPTDRGWWLDGAPSLGDWGVSVGVLRSQQWENITLHMNSVFELRDNFRKVGNFSSVVLEGPADWAVRPTLEVYADFLFESLDFAELSSLVGVVADVSENWSLMGGVRVGELILGPDIEIRFSVWTSFTLVRPREPSTP